MATITIDAGHGGTDPGAVNGGRQEKTDALALAIAVGRILECRCHRVIYTRQTDVFVPLNERARISNAANSDMFVSIHRNSSAITTANGVDTFISPSASQRSTQFANNVLNRVLALNVFANRGVRTGNFVVLNSTNAPAQLLEVGFISNAEDNQRFDQNFSRIAIAIADGIEDSVGRVANCTCAPSGTTPPVTPPPPPTTGGLRGTITTAGGNLNVRAAASPTADIIGSLPNGSVVTILGQSGNFFRINFGGRDGFVSRDFVRVIPTTGTVTTAGGNLNMRNAPNATAAIITTIPNGSSVQVIGQSGDFFQIRFGGNEGWASRNFIRI